MYNLTNNFDGNERDGSLSFRSVMKSAKTNHKAAKKIESMTLRNLTQDKLCT